jgi:hypothetical protein
MVLARATNSGMRQRRAQASQPASSARRLPLIAVAVTRQPRAGVLERGGEPRAVPSPGHRGHHTVLGAVHPQRTGDPCLSSA